VNVAARPAAVKNLRQVIHIWSQPRVAHGGTAATPGILSAAITTERVPAEQRGLSRQLTAGNLPMAQGSESRHDGPIQAGHPDMKTAHTGSRASYSESMTSPSDESAVSELQDLITESGTVREFLDELTLFAARTIGPAIGHPVECAVALRRRRRTITIAGSSEEARALDQIEQALGGGPCMLALETNTTVLLNDVNGDPRWPEFQRELTTHGYHAVLGIPLELGKDSWAALDLFAPAAGAFTPASITIAENFATIAGDALRLAVRIGTEQLLAEDLKAAMKNRSTIDLACGAIMAQNRCSQETAFAILTRASNHRNKKLHQVAEELLLGVSGNVPPETRFDA
jgi:hypothetical protein